MQYRASMQAHCLPYCFCVYSIFTCINVITFVEREGFSKWRQHLGLARRYHRLMFGMSKQATFLKSQWYVTKLSVRRTLDDQSPHLLYLCRDIS